MGVISLASAISANAQYIDISQNVTISKTSQAFDRINKVLFVYVKIANNSPDPVEIGSRLVISNSNFSVINQDGINEEGNPYFSIRGKIASGDTEAIRVNFPVQRGQRKLDTLKNEGKNETGSSRQRARAVFDATLFANQVDMIENPENTPDDIKGVTKSDLNGNQVTTYIYGAVEATAVKITEGIDFGKPEKFEIVTNGFIQITYPPEIKKPQIIGIRPSKKGNTVLVHDSKNGFMKKTPFMVNDDNEIVFKVEPINGKIIFSIVNELE